MEYLKVETTQSKILCCECGVPIDPNPTNSCVACIRANNDISKDISKVGTIFFCRACERYLEPPTTWVVAALESKELLRFCLKRIKGLSTVRLIDASFVWTEPHSKRLKVKLTIQKEIQTGAVLQQEFVVEFVIQNQMCDDCHKVEAKDYWNAVVQVRQRTDHKKTFYYLEQLLLKYQMHRNTIAIKPCHGGLDFFYTNEQGAQRMVDFLTSVIPCRWIKSKKLISRDVHSNTYNYKFTYSVEIVPVCKDNVVCLPPKLAKQLGNMAQICVVLRATNHIFVIDPNTAQIAEMSSSLYFKNPFESLSKHKKLKKYVVIEVDETQVHHFAGQGRISQKHTVSDVWIQRESELGSGKSIFCRTHLGNIINPGDTILGFDLENTNANDKYFDKLQSQDLPNVVLVKKVFAEKAYRNRRRKWRLRHLGIDDDMNSQNRDYTDFLEDLEEDPQLRANISLYRRPPRVDATPSECLSDVDDLPTVDAKEILDEIESDIDEPTLVAPNESVPSTSDAH